ncbi:hypothetical protein BKA67DRAFT_562515 [Truncatella angustata]|uniref:Uncharacterized protein n=1 Tax=Truncatella angustata TaxID=152316 RepID=A0A9P9A0J0_9PEZI|nr:uncharacterized protein BKA67DRAFT_562515 [Truncatella angustata]KAH6656049.1 hypothetical protein BKA67DRAFT_562515 [Truncatella angustata]KAH8198397.1 hypothetical protein TruAng_007432 [Truncatella angustata]
MAEEEDCYYLVYHGAIAKGDPDISGIGVIVAFVSSAYVTFFTVLAAYIGGLIDDELLNDVDRRILRIRPFIKGKNKTRIQNCIRHVILVLSDQQIVTGIAIMAAGFYGLQSKEISVYHYQIVLYLAWMSSSVHLSAITLLHSFISQHRGLLLWRVSGMVVLMVMLVIGLVPTISNDWGIIWWKGMLEGRTGWAIPAYCFWGNTWGDGIGPDAPIGFVILISGYLWKFGELSKATCRACRVYIQDPVERWLMAAITCPAMKVWHGRNSRLWLWIFRIVLASILPVLAAVEVASSFVASLWLSFTSLVYGSIQIFVPRSQMLPLTGPSENNWGFGQLVPLILLLQPLGVIFEHVWSEEENGLHIGHSRESTNSTSSHSRAIPALANIGGSKPNLLELLVTKQTGDDPGSNRRFLEVWDLLYSSKLFAAMVYLVHLAIAIICAMVFYVNVSNTGTMRSDNWQLILLSIAALLAFSFITTTVLARFSITGAPPTGNFRSSMLMNHASNIPQERFGHQPKSVRPEVGP